MIAAVAVKKRVAMHESDTEILHDNSYSSVHQQHFECEEGIEHENTLENENNSEEQVRLVRQPSDYTQLATTMMTTMESIPITGTTAATTTTAIAIQPQPSLQMSLNEYENLSTSATVFDLTPPQYQQHHNSQYTQLLSPLVQQPSQQNEQQHNSDENEEQEEINEVAPTKTTTIVPLVMNNNSNLLINTTTAPAHSGNNGHTNSSNAISKLRKLKRGIKIITTIQCAMLLYTLLHISIYHLNGSSSSSSGSGTMVNQAGASSLQQTSGLAMITEITRLCLDKLAIIITSVVVMIILGPSVNVTMSMKK